MTGRLYVHLECGYSGDVAKGVLTTLVGNVYAVTPGNPSLRQVALPLGWEASPASFDLAAGRYIVEASLPSGQILSDDVEVRDGEDVTVRLNVTESPHETHILQYVVGNIEPSAVYHGAGSYPVPRSQGSRGFAGHVPGPVGADLPQPVDVAMLPRGDTRPLSIENLNALRDRHPIDAVRGVEDLVGRPGPATPMLPSYPEQHSPIFRLDDLTMPGVPGTSPLYQYATATAPADAYLITVPWPWPDSGGGRIPVEVLLNLRQSPTGSAVSVAVRDPVVGGGLGYLAAGSLEKAAVMFTDVESMLYTKVSNPLGAAAGGYVLIGTETSGELQRWDSWLGNLRVWYPQLSDGAILWGARRLRTAREEGHLDEARSALLEGYQRGMPVYTLGLTWLIDGLSAFPEDPACAAALQQVRQLCWRVDMREPFVILRLGEHQ
jgi:hypothetical protein